jgi:hypothetical protein
VLFTTVFSPSFCSILFIPLINCPSSPLISSLYPPTQIHEDHPNNVESLQYLEALCKDLGRPHEEYSAKLEKLRRSQPQPQATQQGGAASTRVEQQQTQQQQGGGGGGGQRSERPSRPDRGGGGEESQPATRYLPHSYYPLFVPPSHSSLFSSYIILSWRNFLLSFEIYCSFDVYQ